MSEILPLQEIRQEMSKELPGPEDLLPWDRVDSPCLPL